MKKLIPSTVFAVIIAVFALVAILFAPVQPAQAVTNVATLASAGTTNAIAQPLRQSEAIPQIHEQVKDFYPVITGLVGAVNELLVPQIDTNATTTATLYTPRRIGDVLNGNTASTNTFWLSNGTTTNDWVKYWPGT